MNKNFWKRAIACLLLITLLSVAGCRSTKQEKPDGTSSLPAELDSSLPENVPTPESSAETESMPEPEPVSSAPAPASKPAPAPQPTPAPQPAPAPAQPYVDYQYHTDLDINDNVFLDALVYTGYNLAKHRSDGLMWVYILASQKRAKGWLSPLGYSGNSSGYEADASGRPDIARMAKQGGLVCASYATYVYFNYLPRVAGIDTSFLPKPERSYDANAWYNAGKAWVNAGYSRYIPFRAKLSGSFISFAADEEIPIGSLLLFCEGKSKTSDHGAHICLYAGRHYEPVQGKDYHWVTHVGNDNGPEFCAVERMSCGPDPMWPIAIITPPSNLRMAAGLSITVTDEAGTPVPEVQLKAVKQQSGTEYALGKTSAEGSFSKEGLPFGDYTLTLTAADGVSSQIALKLGNQNNSLNSFAVRRTADGFVLAESGIQQ